MKEQKFQFVLDAHAWDNEMEISVRPEFPETHRIPRLNDRVVFRDKDWQQDSGDSPGPFRIDEITELDDGSYDIYLSRPLPEELPESAQLFIGQPDG